MNVKHGCQMAQTWWLRKWNLDRDGILHPIHLYQDDLALWSFLASCFSLMVLSIQPSGFYLFGLLFFVYSGILFRPSDPASNLPLNYKTRISKVRYANLCTFCFLTTLLCFEFSFCLGFVTCLFFMWTSQMGSHLFYHHL